MENDVIQWKGHNFIIFILEFVHELGLQISHKDGFQYCIVFMEAKLWNR